MLNCLLYFIPRLFADRLAIDGELQKNRNFFYAVRREDVVRAFQEELWRFCDNNNVTFVSFNYDGLLEAFLDCALGPGTEQIIFRYYPESSHGIPLTMPEYALGRQFGHNFSDRKLKEARSSPMIFKPHGSMHFYTIRPEMAKIMGAPSMLAVHPRFGMPGIAHNDIPELSIWDSASPAPFIIPPVMNKDQFLLEDYSRLVIPKMIRALRDADYIVSLGFSIPRSDLYIRSLLRLLNHGPKREKDIALIWQERSGDATLENWCSLFGEGSIKHRVDTGLPLESVRAVKLFWNQIEQFL